MSNITSVTVPGSKGAAATDTGSQRKTAAVSAKPKKYVDPHQLYTDNIDRMNRTDNKFRVSETAFVQAQDKIKPTSSRVEKEELAVKYITATRDYHQLQVYDAQVLMDNVRGGQVRNDTTGEYETSDLLRLTAEAAKEGKALKPLYQAAVDQDNKNLTVAIRISASHAADPEGAGTTAGRLFGVSAAQGILDPKAREGVSDPKAVDRFQMNDFIQQASVRADDVTDPIGKLPDGSPIQPFRDDAFLIRRNGSLGDIYGHQPGDKNYNKPESDPGHEIG